MGRLRLQILPIVFMNGQSNESGQADISEAVDYPTTNSGVMMFWRPLTGTDDRSIAHLGSLTFEEMEVGVNNTDPSKIDQGNEWFGIETSLGQLLYEKFGRKIYFSKASRGGTAISEWINTLSALSGRYYFSHGTQALAYSGRCVCIIKSWMQGESDSDTSNEANNYATRLASTWTNLESWSNLLKKGKRVISLIDVPIGSYPYKETVRQALTDYANDNNCILIETNDLPRKVDETHLTGAGQETKGERIYSALNY